MKIKEKLIKRFGPQNFYRMLHFAGMSAIAIVVTFMMNNSYMCVVAIVVTFMMTDSYICGYENGAQDVTDYILEHPDILNDKEN